MKIIKSLSIVLLLFISFTTFAQSRHKEKQEQIRALKIAYITNQLQLTSEEAAKFWPLYNTFDLKQRELKHNKIRSNSKGYENSDLDKMSEKESNNLLNQLENSEEELYTLRKKFNSDLKEILPSIKIIKLKKAEEGFNKKLFQQYKDKLLSK